MPPIPIHPLPYILCRPPMPYNACFLSIFSKSVIVVLSFVFMKKQQKVIIVSGIDKIWKLFCHSPNSCSNKQYISQGNALGEVYTVTTTIFLLCTMDIVLYFLFFMDPLSCHQACSCFLKHVTCYIFETCYMLKKTTMFQNADSGYYLIP